MLCYICEAMVRKIDGKFEGTLRTSDLIKSQ